MGVTVSVWNERPAAQEKTEEKGTGLPTRYYKGE
jgi:hypothetical protein